MQINWSVVVIFIIVTCKQIYVRGLSWPSGSYGLPRPQTGCPDYWKEGYRYQDTEDEHSSNRFSRDSYHLSGTVSKHGIRQEFCMKEESLFDDVDMKWPDGKYCIYKYGDECPDGLKEGWVFWDDENIEELDGGNIVDGYTPVGVYEKDTLIYFCCNDKGNVTTPIELPLTKPFYMFPYGSSECQKVVGSQMNIEFIQWDDEDRGNRNSHSKYVPYGVDLDHFDTMLYYCYYDAGICGKYGTSCRNVSIDENKLEGKSTIMKTPDRSNQKWDDMVHGRTRGNSLTAMIIGCSVAGVLLGTAFTGLVVRRLLNKQMGDSYEGDIDESLPLPDHECRNQTINGNHTRHP